MKSKGKFISPLPNFRQQAKKHIQDILVSFKTKNKVVTNNINKAKGNHKEENRKQKTPRGQLHNETIYGKSKRMMSKPTKITKRLSIKQIDLIANEKQKAQIKSHLAQFENRPEIAFDTKTLKKNPLLYQGNPLKEVLCYEEIYTIRKDISPDLKIEKVVDPKIQQKLRERLAKYNNKPKEAFSNLEQNPIWLNEDKGIQIKRVTITGRNNVEALHYKKDHFGNEILDENGKKQAVDFVSTGNNHHIAIYQDNNGKLQEKVVSFYEAVAKATAGLPVIDKNYNADLGWEFQFTMKQNEMFVFPSDDFNPQEIDLEEEKNTSLISKHLFRVQKISTKNYLFTHHLETKAINNDIMKNKKQLESITYNLIQSTEPLRKIIKVRINHLSKIVQVGEY